MDSLRKFWICFKSRHIQIGEVDGDNWCVDEVRISPCDFFSDVDQILQKMKAPQERR